MLQTGLCCYSASQTAEALVGVHGSSTGTSGEYVTSSPRPRDSFQPGRSDHRAAESVGEQPVAVSAAETTVTVRAVESGSGLRRCSVENSDPARTGDGDAAADSDSVAEYCEPSTVAEQPPSAPDLPSARRLSHALQSDLSSVDDVDDDDDDEDDVIIISSSSSVPEDEYD